MVKVKLTENIRNGKIFRHAIWTYYPSKGMVEIAGKVAVGNVCFKFIRMDYDWYFEVLRSRFSDFDHSLKIPVVIHPDEYLRLNTEIFFKL